MTAQAHLPAVTLVCVQPERNERRFYRLVIWPDVFGGVALVREWGRIGQPGQVRRDTFHDASGAAKALGAFRRLKVRRGYRQMDVA